MEIIHTEVIDKDIYPRFVEAEIKIWRKVEDIDYAEGKHPDEVYVGYFCPTPRKGKVRNEFYKFS